MTTKSKKTSARKNPSKVSMATARDKRIVFVVDENPKRKGTTTAKIFDAAKRYTKSHRNATVGEVMEKAGYRVEDFHWDMERKFIVVK